MDENILIKNAKIVDEGSIVEGDVLIRKGIIERIDPSISLPVGTRLILADNQYLLPGPACRCRPTIHGRRFSSRPAIAPSCQQ